jgi:hypothetical protein
VKPPDILTLVEVHPHWVLSIYWVLSKNFHTLAWSFLVIIQFKAGFWMICGMGLGFRVNQGWILDDMWDGFRVYQGWILDDMWDGFRVYQGWILDDIWDGFKGLGFRATELV